MDFTTFLKQAKQKSFWQKHQVVCFKGGSNYPCAFFTKLFDFLEKKQVLPAPRKNVLIGNAEKKNIFASLQQSFLGQKTFYWLSSYQFGKTERGNKKELFQMLTNYTGDNFISFYLDDEKLTSKYKSSLKNICIVDVEEQIDKTLFGLLLKLFEKTFDTKKMGFITQVFKVSPTLFLDKALLLLRYVELVNVRYIDEYQDYLLSILVDIEPSLHVLAQHFFSKQPEQFFDLWSKLQHDYSEMFWIAFWTNKLFRAYYFIKYAQKKDFAKARSMSFGLPFMFVKRDWQHFSLHQLAKYHTFLYNSDFKYKTGSTFCSLDLFYLKHFCGKKKVLRR